MEGPFEGSASLIAVAGPSSALIFTRVAGKIPANVQGSFWILAGNALVPEELIFEISDVSFVARSLILLFHPGSEDLGLIFQSRLEKYTWSLSSSSAAIYFTLVILTSFVCASC